MATPLVSSPHSTRSPLSQSVVSTVASGPVSNGITAVPASHQTVLSDGAQVPKLPERIAASTSDSKSVSPTARNAANEVSSKATTSSSGHTITIRTPRIMMRRGGGSNITSRLSLGSLQSSSTAENSSPAGKISDMRPPPSGGGLGLTPRSASASSTPASRPSVLSNSIKPTVSIANHPKLLNLQRQWENQPSRNTRSSHSPNDGSDKDSNRISDPKHGGGLKRQAPQTHPAVPAAKRQQKPETRTERWDKTPSWNGNQPNTTQSSDELDPLGLPTLLERPVSSILGDQTNNMNEEPDSDETDSNSDIPNEPITLPLTTHASTGAHPSAYSQSTPELVVSDVQAEMTETQDGRPYRHYFDERGMIKKQSGALLPTSYEPDKDHDFPWICPVRDCRKRQKRLDGLSGHFNAVHFGVTLNDNLDGTFSVVGKRQANSGEKTQPAMVISQNKIDPTAPIAEAAVPSYKLNLMRKSQQTPKRLRNAKSTQAVSYGEPRLKFRTSIPITAPHPGRLSVQEQENNIRIGRQLMEDLARNQGYSIPRAFYNDPDWDLLLRKHRQRILPASTKLCGTGRRLSETAFVGMIMYLIGNNRKRKCNNCFQAGVECVGPPPKYSRSVAKRITRECAGCMMGSPQIQCTHALSGTGSAYAEESTFEDAELDGDEEDDENEEEEEDEQDTEIYGAPDSAGSAVQSQNAPQAASEEVAQDLDDITLENDVAFPAVRSLRPRESSQSRSRVHSARPAPPAQTRTGTPTSGNGYIVHPGQYASVDMDAMLEMEDWEIAPGRLRRIDSSEGICLLFIHIRAQGKAILIQIQLQEWLIQMLSSATTKKLTWPTMSRSWFTLLPRDKLFP